MKERNYQRETKPRKKAVSKKSDKSEKESNEDSKIKRESKKDSEKEIPMATEKDPEIEEAVGKILNNLINSTGLDADVYVRDQMEEGSIVFELEGKDSGLLIGRRGETLSSLEYLVRLMVIQSILVRL